MAAYEDLARERGYSAPMPDSVVDDPEASLEQLIHLNTRILNAKLAVIASHVVERLRIHGRNVLRIDEDQSMLASMMEHITRGALYGLRQHQDKRIHYQKLFELEEERRRQDVECWRDIVLVMRDFLTFWDAHEHAQARAIFLKDAGT